MPPLAMQARGSRQYDSETFTRAVRIAAMVELKTPVLLYIHPLIRSQTDVMDGVSVRVPMR